MTENYRKTRAQWPIPLNELRARRDQMERSQWWPFIIVVMAVPIAVVSGCVERSEAGSTWWDEILMSLALLCMFGFFAGAFIGAYIGIRDFDLRCPGCRKILAGKTTMPVAIATGRCGSCGELLVSDHPMLKPLERERNAREPKAMG